MLISIQPSTHPLIHPSTHPLSTSEDADGINERRCGFGSALSALIDAIGSSDMLSGARVIALLGGRPNYGMGMLQPRAAYPCAGSASRIPQPFPIPQLPRIPHARCSPPRAAPPTRTHAESPEASLTRVGGIALKPHCNQAPSPPSLQSSPSLIALNPCLIAIKPCLIALKPCLIALKPCLIALNPSPLPPNTSRSKGANARGGKGGGAVGTVGAVALHGAPDLEGPDLEGPDLEGPDLEGPDLEGGGALDAAEAGGAPPRALTAADGTQGGTHGGKSAAGKSAAVGRTPPSAPSARAGAAAAAAAAAGSAGGDPAEITPSEDEIEAWERKLLAPQPGGGVFDRLAQEAVALGATIHLYALSEAEVGPIRIPKP